MSIHVFTRGDDLVSVTPSPAYVPGAIRPVLGFGPSLDGPDLSITITRAQAEALSLALTAWLSASPQNVLSFPTKPGPEAA